MITGTTSSGFKFHVPEGLAKDPKFLRAFISFGNKDLPVTVRMDSMFDVVSAVFNDEREEECFYKHLAHRNPTGRADINDVAKEINEIATICRNEDEGIKKS